MALIDPGSGDPEELEKLFELIGMLEDDRRRLTLVLLTHHHPDHLGGLEAVRARWPRARVAAHAETARHVKVDLTLADGDWVPLVPGVGDWALRAIHTPGHARGHLCFHHARTRSLFSGDTVVGGAGTVIIDPPEGDMGDYVASLRRLLELRVDTLFPGHGAPQGAAAKRITGLIAHREAREARVLGALGPEPRSLPALLERVYDDTPRELWPYAERSLLAHLLKLGREGRARERDGGWAAP
jgi:glyoxylase-like metal-dependent hydrolase (beta-lactamase superfamily II)